MSAFRQIGSSGMSYSTIGSIPKNDSAYRLMQAPQYAGVRGHKGLGYSGIGDVNWSTNEFWGTLLSGAVVGVMAVTLFNRYYK